MHTLIPMLDHTLIWTIVGVTYGYNLVGSEPVKECPAVAILAKAQARAQALNTLGAAIGRQNGDKAASLAVAEQYVAAFSQLARTTNTLILPEKTGDISSMVSQAVGIFGHMTSNSPLKSADGEEGTPHDPPSTEQTLEQLTASIDKTIDESVFRSVLSEEKAAKKDRDTHFTLDTSPTRPTDDEK
ncbi:stomatin-like protein 2, mitochondrial [Halichondria panicea]|uniref:stomatin-like protein 2, mitochondrial n=1 Tax=Halichondria panicea TaxID=6063 RepID=UPI00312BB45E